MKTVLVTAVGAPPGLNVVRAIHESGDYNVVVSDANKHSVGLYQYNLPSLISPLTSNDSYIQEIIAFSKKNNVCGIIPCIEEEVLLLAREVKTLKESGISVNLPNYKTVKIASNKGLMTKKCEENNIPCPDSIVLTNNQKNIEDKVDAFFKRQNTSCIVKPTFGHGMKGVFTVNSPKEAVEKIRSLDRECILQEKIPGGAGSMYLSALLYDKKGNVVRSFASRSLLTLYEDGGPATAGESIHSPVLISRLETLVNSVGPWSGPINAEWMLDPRDNEWKFIEINPRHWGYGYLAVASGCNMPLANANIICDDNVSQDSGYNCGVVMARNTFDYVLNKHPFKLLSK